jgi:hypothetical protein
MKKVAKPTARRGSESSPSNEDKSWKPNSVTLAERVVNLLLALVLLAHGASGFLYSKLVVSPPRQAMALTLLDGSAWLMAAAMITGAFLLLSVVVDHYDKRNNEKWYRAFKHVALILGLGLVASSLVSYFIAGLTS